jgi:hypothetical protein
MRIPQGERDVKIIELVGASEDSIHRRAQQPRIPFQSVTFAVFGIEGAGRR